MKRIHRVFVGISVIAALGLSTAAFAHCDEGMAAGQNCMHGEMGEHGMAGKGEHMSPAMIEKRFDKFKSELKITPAQDAAWQTFVAKTKQQHEASQAMHEKMQPGSAAATAPERMEKGIEMMKQRLAHMEAMAAAMKEFYAQLTPEQKAVADKHFSHMAEQFRNRARPAGKEAK